MARLVGPDPNTRTAWAISGGVFQSVAGTTAIVYTDSAGTTPANIATYDPANPTTVGATISGATVTLDSNSRLPLFWFPDGVDTLYVSVNSGPISEIHANYDPRLDTLEAAVASLQTAGTTAALNAKTVVTVGPVGADFVTDGVADDVQIQAAINQVAAQSTGGTVFLRAGTYSIAATITCTASNIVLRGEGPGVTRLVGASTLTGDTPLLLIGPATAGADKALTAGTAVSDRSFLVSTTDASTFTVGDTILLKSGKSVDADITATHAGELHYVSAINGSTGAVTVSDVILDTYLTADTAAATKVTMASNVTVQGLSCTTAATTSALTSGFLHFRWVDGLTVRDVEMHHTYYGMQIRSCLNVRLAGCNMHDISPTTAAATARYGVWITGASQRIQVEDCQFRGVRYGVTTGGSTGTNDNGIQRDIAIDGCTSSQADTAHFNTADCTDGLVITGCTMVGGATYQGAASPVYGVQTKGRNVSVTDCTIRNIPGRGVGVLNANSTGTVIADNTISGIQLQQGGAAGGEGIYLDANGAGSHVIDGNVIRNCVGPAVSGAGGNNDLVITNNSVDTASSYSGAAMVFTNALRGVVSGNRVTNNGGRPLQLSGTSDGWQVTGNSFQGSGTHAPQWAGATSNSVCSNNLGLNPDAPFSLGTGVSGAVTVSRTNGRYQFGTLTGNVTFTVSAGQVVGDELVLALTQDATGGRTVTWPSNVKLAGGSMTLSSASTTDQVTFCWDGSNWREKARALANSSGSSYVDTLIASTPAFIRYNTGTSSWPARSSVTSDTNRTVLWIGPSPGPTIGGSGAVDGVDLFEATS